MTSQIRMTLLAAASAAALLAAANARAETQIVVGSTTYSDFSSAIANGTPPAPGTAVWLNADNVAANTSIRATQRSLGFHEVDYKAAFSAKLNFTPVIATPIGANNVYDYSAQSSKSTDLVGFWKSKDLPIVIGPDGKAYITDGHHTTAGYLAAATLPREIVAGQGHVVLGHVVANYYDPASPSAPGDAWWTARQSENNALLNGPNGNLLTQPGDADYAATRPILPSTQAMPTVPGKTSMTDAALRSVTWGMADGIANGKKGYSKVNSLAAEPQPDINFVEFYWADFLRNRVVFDDSHSGSPLGSGKPDANLIAAPIAFYAAVANGTALAKSAAYQDQYGRSLATYNDAAFGTNTQTWAGASLKNGLAKSSDVYEMYLLDDSTVQGDILPSATSTNHLHIDSVGGQVIGGAIGNFASVDVNRGAAINITWKDAVLTPQNSTLTIVPGTGKVTLIAHNGYAGTTRVGAGTLEVAATGSIDNSSAVVVDAGATLINNGSVGGGGVTGYGTIGGSGVFDTLTTIAAGGHLSPGNSPGTITFARGLTLADGAALDFDLGTASDLIRVSGGLLSGSGDHGIAVDLKLGSGFQFGTRYALIDWTGAASEGVDAGDFFLTDPRLDHIARFSRDGDTIKLSIGGVPEPETYAMMIAGFGILGATVRRRRRAIA